VKLKVNNIVEETAKHSIGTEKKLMHTEWVKTDGWKQREITGTSWVMQSFCS
jgi:hypothetical protein